MAVLSNLKSTNATIEQKLEANTIKGSKYEGLPIASKTEYGVVKFDNSTIKLNTNNELYVVFNDSNNFDNTEIISHIQNSTIHLSSSQVKTISDSFTHINDENKHISLNDREKLNNFSQLVTDLNIHMSNKDYHLSIQEKNNLTLSYEHINDNDKHISESDRDTMDSAISLIENFNTHEANEDIHFTNGEKAAFRNGIADCTMSITDLRDFKTSTELVLSNKLNTTDHSPDKIIITDSEGNITYHDTPASEIGNTDTSYIENQLLNHIGNPYVHKDPNETKITVSETAPTNPRVGDLWVIW